MSWQLHGYAIISDDDCIADRNGELPESLKNKADWDYFQGQLDRSVLSILGRRSHQSAPNPKHRRRVVVSSGRRGLTQGSDAWWWNPADLSLTGMLEILVPEGGRIAVPGGCRVFDLVLGHGFDSFHLARKTGLVLPGGVPIFSGVREGSTAEDCLAERGLKPAIAEMLDPSDNVTLTVWHH